MKLICILIIQFLQINTDLLKYIQDFELNENHKNLNISISIKSISKNENVFNYFENRGLPPASTLKLISTATAFKVLGADFQFSTNFYYTGQIIDGVLKGNILVISVGDPTFGAKRYTLSPFDQLAQALKTLNVSKIEGKVILIDKTQCYYQKNWPSGDVGNYYGAFPVKFNFNENLYVLGLKSGNNIGDSTLVVGINPENLNLQLTNNILTGAENSGDETIIYNIPQSNHVVLTGTIPANRTYFEIKGAVPDPNLNYINCLTNQLFINGISVANQDLAHADSTWFCTILSPKLSKIAQSTNFQSINFYADGLLNYMTQDKDFDKFIKETWQNDLPEISNLNFDDGSGLSPNDLVSTKFITDFLSHLSKQNFYEAFKSTIPVVGKSGTVSNIKLNKASMCKILAKSGSINAVRNYAGYFTNKNSEEFAFAIFVSGITKQNKSDLKQFFETIFNKLTDLE